MPRLSKFPAEFKSAQAPGQNLSLKSSEDISVTGLEGCGLEGRGEAAFAGSRSQLGQDGPPVPGAELRGAGPAWLGGHTTKVAREG